MGIGYLLTLLLLLSSSNFICDSAKINTPRVLLPWFENLYVNFTFEIIEGGCYTWSLSRDDIIDLELLYEDSWGHCSRAARVSVSKTCVSPGSVIILAQEVNSGEILRGDVDVDKISSLKVTSTTWKLYLEEAPEAFEVIAYDEQGNKFSTLEGVTFSWFVENIGSNVGEPDLVTFVPWSETDYEAPRGVTELETIGIKSYSVLLYGQAMGDCQVTVCLDDICTQFTLQVVPSVVLTPATAIIALGDTLRYRVVKVFGGRLTVQEIPETLYYTKLLENEVAFLEDSISLVRGLHVGTTNVFLKSGVTEVTSAVLTVAEPYSIRVTLRPSGLIIRGEKFIIHSILLDEEGRAITAGDEILIRLSVEGDANVDLLRSTQNGTLTDAMAQNAGTFTVTARLHSIAGKMVSHKVEGQVSAIVEDPLEVVPPELFVAWTDTIQEVNLKHIGGGDEPVTWSMSEPATEAFSLTHAGVMLVRGAGNVAVHVHLTKHPHVRASGRVWSAPIELLQVSSSGRARIGRPHALHIAVTAAHPSNGELYNFNVCDCASFAVALLEGPEPHNVTAAPWIQPIEGACCAVEVVFSSRGVSTLRVSRGRVADSARVSVSAAPALLWPARAAALPGATLPVLAEGEALVPHAAAGAVASLDHRHGPPPYKHPEAHLFTLKCHKKGESVLELVSRGSWERASLSLESACAPHVARLRLDPAAPADNCSGPARVWLRPGQDVSVKVTLFDVIGRELLDERGPRVSWDIEPNHIGIEYRSNDRLFVEIHPDFEPVPVPYKFYQLVVANEKAIGWSGLLKASIGDATANIQAKVVAPLKCEPLKVHMAWEGENSSVVSTVRGGSGRYAVEAGGGATGAVREGALLLAAPAPGLYHVRVADTCVHDQHLVEVHMEEILSVEVSTSRAVSVGGCVPITALVKGISQRYLTISSTPEWRTHGHVVVKDGQLCGVKEGTGRVRAAVGGVWSSDVEVGVFGPLRIEPARARVAVGGTLQLRALAGPPPHLAATHYAPLHPHHALQVSSTGLVHGLTTGTARIRLVAIDSANVEIDSAEAEIEVVGISGLKVHVSTRTLLVGRAAPLWLEAAGLGGAALSALQPPPKLQWSLRDPRAARLYTSYTDDQLERSSAEGLSVRVVPLKPGVITIDVKVRNMGQAAETRSWDSTVEILAIADITTSVKGVPNEISSGDRIALAVGAVVRLQSSPRSNWKAYSDGAFDVTSAGELKALAVGHGVVVAHHRDERNNIYRETAVQVEVAVPQYCTVEASEAEERVLRCVARNSVGRALLAPHANLTASPAGYAHVHANADSVLGPELVLTGVETTGAYMTFHSSMAGVTVTDEVWIPGDDGSAERIVATGGWVVCLSGAGWRGGAGAAVHSARGAALAVLTHSDARKVVLKRERPPATLTVHQLPLQQLEFMPGEWSPALVPLTLVSEGVTSGPVLCSEEQKYLLEGVEVELPYTCTTDSPHQAEPVLDLINGRLGCKVQAGAALAAAAEVEVCAAWGVVRGCTRVLLLPPLLVSQQRVSVVDAPAAFAVRGHPHALRLVKLTASPGLKLETANKEGEITVIVANEASTCDLGGYGWVTVNSKLTAQEFKIDVQRECDVAYGTVLGALFSLIRPYLSTLATIVAAIGAYIYIQSKLQQKVVVRMPTSPALGALGPMSQTVLPPLSQGVSPPSEASPLGRTRQWSRSPAHTPHSPHSPHAAPAAPAYGDASFSPNSQRNRFMQ